MFDFVKIQVGSDSPFHELEVEVHRLVRQSGSIVSDTKRSLIGGCTS